MRFSTVFTAVAPFLGAALAQSGSPGYTPVASTISESNNTFSFGSNFAVLNLDMINGLVIPVASTTEGKAWIKSVSQWINAVHAHTSKPLQIFTRIYFQPGHPEVGASSPFAAAASALFGVTENNGTAGQLYPAFVADPLGYANGTSRDVVLQKTRYDATYGNQLKEILIAQKIDTVILSGIRTSGVILSTAYTLFDLDYTVYVISNNSIESPSNAPGIDAAIKGGILPKLPANVINIEQALAALKRSG